MIFIVSGESVNSYGFRVLNSALKIEGFLDNPVCFWNHDRNRLPIGKWKNLYLREGKWQAEVELDMEDELAKKIQQKIVKGIINTCSIGFMIDASEMIDNVMTVTEATLVEISLSDIPSNKNAVKLYHKESKQSGFVGLSNQETEDFIIHYKKNLNMTEEDKKFFQDLLTKETKVLSEQNQNLQKELDTLKAQVKLDAGGSKVGESKANTNPEDLTSQIANLTSKIEDLEKNQNTGVISELIKALGQGNLSQQVTGREDWDFRRWYKEDPKGLEVLKAENPERYNELLKTLKR